jgi:hypothetical protein
MEFRKGIFRDFVGSIFIRETNEVRLTRKYNYIHDKWIFEAFSRNAYSPEVPGTEGGDYIPIYVFQNSMRAPLPITKKVLEFLVGTVNGRVERDKIPSQEYLDDVEVGKMEESMDDHPSDFSTRPGPQRNAVAYTKELK